MTNPTKIPNMMMNIFVGNIIVLIGARLVIFNEYTDIKLYIGVTVLQIGYYFINKST
jgi:hypothetical protein